MFKSQRNCVQLLAILAITLGQLSLFPNSVGAQNKRPELLLSLGHYEKVSSVAQSGDGKLVLTGSWDSTAILWDRDSGKPLQFFKGHGSGQVTSVALSRDGRRVLTGSYAKIAILWDAATGKPMQILKGHTGSIHAVALSADGKRALTGSDDSTAILWDADTGQPIHTLKGHTQWVNAVALSGDGKRALTGSGDRTAILWDVATAQPLQTFKGHTDQVNAVALSGDGKRVLTGGSEDKTAILWEADTAKRLQTFQHTKFVTSVALNGDGKRALIGYVLCPERAILWDAGTGKPLHILNRPADTKGIGWTIEAVALSDDGKRALTGCANATAILWDADVAQPLQTFRRQVGGVTPMALSDNRKWLLTQSGGGGNNAILWDVSTGKPIHTLKGHTNWITGAALSADGQRALTGSFDKTAILWDTGTGKVLRTFSGHTNWITCVALSEDGKRVLTGSVDQTAILWDADTGKRLRTFKMHNPLGNSVEAVALNEDGKRALVGVGGRDNISILWDAETGNSLQTFKVHSWVVRSLALSRDSKRALIPSINNTATQWDATTGKLLHIFQGHAGLVESVALSRDGKRALTGSADFTAILWDADTAKPLQSLTGHNGPIRSVAFPPGGDFLVTASFDGTVRIWKPGREEPVFSFLPAGQEWLFWTPEGYYTCSPNGENLIAWKVYDDSPQSYRIVGPEQFRKKFYRPDLFHYLLSELDLNKALARADKESGRKSGQPLTMVAALPPYVIIAQPLKSGEMIKTEVCEITAKAKGVGDNFVASLQLLVDGVPYDGGRRKFTVPNPRPGEATATWKVSLPPGKRRIQVIAASIQGSTSKSEELEILQDQPETPPKLLLLSVGVSAYTKADLRKGVEYAASDARQFLEAQVKHSKALYQDVETIALTKGDASRAEILDAFEELSKKARSVKNAVTVIFLAGHGTTNELGDFYFLAADSDTRKLRATAIGSAELKDALKNIPGRVVVFLDACHSGVLAGDKFRSTALTDPLIFELNSSEYGVVLICSSRGKELSQQRNAKDEEGGLFARALVEGLSGKAAKHTDGAIYLPALFDHVSRRVRDWSRNEQHPYSTALSKFGDLPLTRP